MPTDVAHQHYEQQRQVAAAAAQVAADAWGRVEPDNIVRSWASLSPEVTVATAGAQRVAAARADSYLDEVLAAQGISTATSGSVVPSSLVGIASDGRPLDTLITQPANLAAYVLAKGESMPRALAHGHASLDMIVRTQVSDAGRVADQVALVAHSAASGYVRVLSPPSCSRCAILAGRWYRYSAGFQRHPRCGCIHLPSTAPNGADLRTDPRSYFDSLSRAEQDRIFTNAGAQAIRDGADISQVVNARRGMYTASGGRQFTRDSTTRRGIARPGRMMPEEIYRVARSREEALSLLRQHGYLRPTAGAASGFSAPAAPRLRLGTTTLPAPTRSVSVRNPAELTGHKPRWWEELKADTGPTPVPVRNMSISTEYLVESGQAWRHSGVTYLVEDGVGMSAGRVADDLRRVHRELPAGADQYQRGYAWLAGRNPADDYWAEKYRMPGFTSAATAGDGAVRMWNRRTSTFGPYSYRDEIQHEFGHNLSSAAAGRGLHDRGDAWADAVAGDRGPELRVSQFHATSMRAIPLNWQPQPGRPFPDGVTQYGASSVGEDYAESMALYLAGPIGSGVLAGSATPVRIYFRDIFPARAAIFDRLLPEVAQQQKAAVAAR